MAALCTLNDYILAEDPSAAGYYWYWDKVLKTLGSRAYASVDDFFELDENSVIDVAESGGRVYIITKKASSTQPINVIFLFSTSGDINNILLSAIVSGGVLTVTMYATVAKETTVLTFNMQVLDNASPPVAFTPCFNNYTIANNVILTSWCDSFTLNEMVSVSGVATLVQTFNSVVCGFSVPISPYRFSEELEIDFKTCVLSNPVCLVWKNLLGGWDYWVFQKKQTESLDTESLGVFRKNYNVISDITNPNTERGKIGGGRIVMGANDLTPSQKIGLKGLLLSNKVYILNQDGTINREVILAPGSFIIKDSSSLEFQINDVEINTIKN